MKNKTNTLLYLFVAIGFILLKVFYKNAVVSDLKFLLAPTNYIVSFCTNSPSIFQNDIGYYFKDLHITIDKSCSGFNFYCMILLMYAFFIIKELISKKSKWLALTMSFIICYCVTLIANTSRIIIAIYSKNLLPQNLYKQTWMHETQGILVYLIYFILFFNLTKIIINKLNHEKTA